MADMPSSFPSNDRERTDVISVNTTPSSSSTAPGSESYAEAVSEATTQSASDDAVPHSPLRATAPEFTPTWAQTPEKPVGEGSDDVYEDANWSMAPAMSHAKGAGKETQAAVGAAAERVVGSAQHTRDKVQATAKDVQAAARSAVDSAEATNKESAQSAVNSVAGTATDAQKHVEATAKNAQVAAGSAINSAAATTRDSAQSAVSGATETAKDAQVSVAQTAQGLAQGAQHQAAAAAQTAQKAVAPVVNSAAATARNTQAAAKAALDRAVAAAREVAAAAGATAEQVADAAEDVQHRVEAASKDAQAAVAPAVNTAKGTTKEVFASPEMQTLRAKIRRSPLQAFAAIARLNKVVSTRRGQDTTMMIMAYSALLGSSVLTQITKAQIYIYIMRLLRLADVEDIPAGTTVLVSAENLPAPKSLVAARKLQAFSGLLGDVRIAMRMFDLFSYIQWAKDTYDNPPADKVTRHVTYGQVTSMLVYQYLETGAYLSGKGVLGWSAEKQNKAWLWSSRAWAAYTALEFASLGRRLLAKKKSRKGSHTAPLMVEAEKAVEDVVEDATLLQLASQDEDWRREMVINSGYAPMTVHWSVNGGVLSPFVVGALGTIVGATKFGYLWGHAA